MDCRQREPIQNVPVSGYVHGLKLLKPFTVVLAKAQHCSDHADGGDNCCYVGDQLSSTRSVLRQAALSWTRRQSELSNLDGDATRP